MAPPCPPCRASRPDLHRRATCSRWAGGDEYAFDVTTRTWILAPTGGVTYKPGVGYVSSP